MAREITCDLCSTEPAMALYSTIADGTTIAIGDMCAPNFVVGLAIAVGVLPDPTAEPDKPVKALPKRRPGKALAEAAEAATDPTEAPTEASEVA